MMFFDTPPQEFKMAPKIAIVYYSMYGHIKQLADAELKGIQEAGGDAKLFQVQETLSEEVLKKMYAPAKAADVPVIEDPSVLEEFDGVLFGIPTRYGNFPAQFKTFWDKTGKQWQQGSFWGKYAGLFISTGTLGGGQESTAIASMSTLVHHGFIYVPLGYKTTFAQLSNLDEVHGGSPWGAGTFSAGDGSRQPTPLELSIATAQGKAFYEAVAKAHP
ncbi:Flavodoxin nitric oxide synthase [Pyrenophora seminiperda CCB06]|uniref:Flavodoxin nitric oxide synthase n=1 Tax=Pyrenophora seminiperda CCB06 TaxID=1302712 RepID=A0A3M7LWW3_9PLEO|nr:Flavodoxin nitric oxide synthase [Pyrenophora seminiperda CCB06]